MGETPVVHVNLHFEPGCAVLGEDLDRLNDRIIELIDREFPHHSGMAMLVELEDSNG